MVPGAHSSGAVEPVAQDEPAGQARHSEADCKPVLFEYVPALHGSSADAPGGQKLPPLQTLHVVAPLLSWNLPPGQRAHLG